MITENTNKSTFSHQLKVTANIPDSLNHIRDQISQEYGHYNFHILFNLVLGCTKHRPDFEYQRKDRERKGYFGRIISQTYYLMFGSKVDYAAFRSMASAGLIKYTNYSITDKNATAYFVQPEHPIIKQILEATKTPPGTWYSHYSYTIKNLNAKFDHITDAAEEIDYLSLRVPFLYYRDDVLSDLSSHLSGQEIQSLGLEMRLSSGYEVFTTNNGLKLRKYPTQYTYQKTGGRGNDTHTSQGIKNEIKRQLFEGLYNYDFQSCHVTLAAKILGSELTNLSYIQSLVEELEGLIGKRAKIVNLSFLYGSTLKQALNKFKLELMEDTTKNVIEQLHEAYGPHRENVNKLVKSYKKESSVLVNRIEMPLSIKGLRANKVFSHILLGEEQYAIRCAMNLSKDLIIASYQYDGFVTIKPIPPSKLKQIQEKTGLLLVLKPF